MTDMNIDLGMLAQLGGFAVVIAGAVWAISSKLSSHEDKIDTKLESIGQRLDSKIAAIEQRVEARDERVVLKTESAIKEHRVEISGDIKLIREELSKARHDNANVIQRALSEMVRKDKYEDFEKVVREGFAEIKKDVSTSKATQAENLKMLIEMKATIDSIAKSKDAGNGD